MPCLKEMGIPDPFTCLLRNLHAGQEATVRTGHETMEWFQIGKEVHQGCILSLCLLTYMQNQSVSQSISSVAQSCPTLCDPMNRSTPGLPVHHQLLEFTQTHVHWISDAIQPFHPLLSLLLLPPIPPSIRVFSNESNFHMRWPKYWSFSFSISPSKEHPGLISFRMDWLDLLAVQETLKSLLQHHSSKASILQPSALFTVHLSHSYMTTGKTTALTRWTFVGKVTSLLLNMLSRLVITFLPRSKRLLISWLQSTSVVILEPPKIKSATVYTVSPSISHEVMGPDAMICIFWMLSFKPIFSLCRVHHVKYQAGLSTSWNKDCPEKYK